MAMGADLNRVPTGCYIEVNNRYVWKGDYMAYYTPHLDRFRFVLGSDAHKPNWLNHVYAIYAAERLGIVSYADFRWAPTAPGNRIPWRNG